MIDIFGKIKKKSNEHKAGEYRSWSWRQGGSGVFVAYLYISRFRILFSVGQDILVKMGAKPLNWY